MGRFAFQGAPSLPCQLLEMSWRRGPNVLPPGFPAGRCRTDPGGAPHLYAPGSPAAPRGRAPGAVPAPAARARADRGGSEAGLSPARRGAGSLLRRRSLIPPPPPSRSLVLSGAAQTCSGAAAPAPIGLGLRPRDPATGAGGDAHRGAALLGTAR